jgi:hypothetical protein
MRWSGEGSAPQSSGAWDAFRCGNTRQNQGWHDGLQLDIRAMARM